jgi:hypothetical protein
VSKYMISKSASKSSVCVIQHSMKLMIYFSGCIELIM